MYNANPLSDSPHKFVVAIIDPGGGGGEKEEVNYVS